MKRFSSKRRPYNPLAVLQAIGRSLVVLGLIASYCWVCGVEHSTDTPSGLHLLWIVPVIAIGAALNWLATDESRTV